MKTKFADYEEQSEKYYADMLDRFKEQARKVVTKKQKELDDLKKQKEKHLARVIRLKERTVDRKIKNFWSDEDTESEEEEPVTAFNRVVDMDEYSYVKAQRKRYKLEIKKWIEAFKKENERNPTDADTQAIALELADFNHANEQYLDLKIALIKQNKYPFVPEDFYKETKEKPNLAMQRRQTFVG